MGETRIHKSPLEVHLIFTGPDVLSAFRAKNESKQRSTAVQALTGMHNTNSDNAGDTAEPVNSLLRNL